MPEPTDALEERLEGMSERSREWLRWLHSSDPAAAALLAGEPWWWVWRWFQPESTSLLSLETAEALEAEAAVPGSWDGYACSDALDLVELVLEQTRRRADGRWPEDDSLHWRALRLAVHVRRYARNRDRQRATCEALGWPWPPSPGAYRRWRWCWEGQSATTRRHPERTIVASPVVYPRDWRQGVEPDAYGAGHRWVAGEVLHLDADEAAEILEAKAAAPPTAATPPPPDRPPARAATDAAALLAPASIAGRRQRRPPTTHLLGRPQPELDGRQ